MKLLKFLIFISITCIVVFSCKQDVLNKNLIFENEKYSILLDYSKSTTTKLKGDFSYVFFENGFDNDSISVFLNKNKIYSGTITTDLSLGLAEDIELGKLSKIKELSFKINNGRDVIIRNINHNSLKVNYKKDSMVRVSFTNKFIRYR